MDNVIKKIVTSEMKAKEYGFYWRDYATVMDQVRSECDEVDELIIDPTSSRERLKEEMGDLLHAVFSLCIYCELDPELTLNNSLNKFEERYKLTKHFAKEDGHHNLHGKTTEEMMIYWNKAKRSD